MSSKIPFNIKLLMLDAKACQGLRQITTLDNFEIGTKNFHPEGLFSTTIFGRIGEETRLRRFAFIDLKVPILHPLTLRILGKLKRIYPEILMGRTYATWDATGRDFAKADALTGETGFHFFMSHYKDIKFPERLSDIRELNIQFIEKMKPLSITERVIVAPAAIRDFVIHPDGREEEDEVNVLYRKLLAVSNSISRQSFETTPKTFDKARASLQNTFTAIYEYFEAMVEGKNKLLMGSFLTRNISYGTRNVITAQNLRTNRLLAPEAAGMNDTEIGLFQYLKAFLPVTTFQIRNDFLTQVFTTPQAPAKLVNMKTLHTEQVFLSSEHFDNWMTTEGVERVINSYGEEALRHEPIIIDGRYLGLIYNDGKSFKLFQDIDELPDNLDRKHVRPITLTELLYIAVYPHTGKYIMNITRFPVTGFGSIYPSKLFLHPTVNSHSLTPMNAFFQPDASMPDKPIAYNFPVRGSSFVNTVMLSPNKLSGLTAD